MLDFTEFKEDEQRAQLDKAMAELLFESCNTDEDVASKAQRRIAKAFETPLRKGILYGDILFPFYKRERFDPSANIEYPLDLISPGTEKNFRAYTNPGHGRVPENAVEADYVRIDTYGVMDSIDFLLRFGEDKRLDILRRSMEALYGSFVKKLNDDGMRTLLAGAADRGILVYDGDAAAAQFTKRLISLLKTVMKRQGGGNSVTANGRATDLCTSPEAIEDTRNWGIDQVDELTRREIYLASDDSEKITRIQGVNLHGLLEFGDGQEYQEFFLNELGGSLGPNSDAELVLALDLSKNDSFIMPIKKELEIFEDKALHRQQRQGYYAWMNVGFGVLDTRRTLAGSF